MNRIRKTITLITFLYLGMLVSRAQITPHYVVGSMGGSDFVGGGMYSFHVGEPCIGTATWGFGVVTIGFHQPTLPIVLESAAQLEINGSWEQEQPKLSISLVSQVQPESYVILRGETPDALTAVAQVSSQSLGFSWLDFGLQGGDRWFYQVRALLVDVASVESNRIELSKTSTLWEAFPNPSHEILHLRGPAAKSSLQVELTNAWGQVIYQLHTGEDLPSAFSHSIDVSSWASGMYWLRVRGEGINWVEKILIRH